jgi:hypothetical protein
VKDEAGMRFLEFEWANKWSAINISPAEKAYFKPVLQHLSEQYKFPMPHVHPDDDGYFAYFELSGSQAIISVDEWIFSISFEEISVRNEVLAHLESLPPDYFK